MIFILLFFQSICGYSQETFPAVLEPLYQTHLYAENQSSIYYEVYTYATEITKKLGDSFKKGDILVKFENRVSLANVVKARSDLAKARVDLHVKKNLFAEHLISELEEKQAEADVANAEFQLILAEKNFAASEVRAPFDGKVADVFIRLYELPERGRPIMDIVNDSIITAKFLVPSYLMTSKKIGDPVFLLIQDTREVIKSRITRMSPVINAASGTVKVEAEINNRSGHLKGGMSSLAAFTEGSLIQKESSVQDILRELKEK